MDLLGGFLRQQIRRRFDWSDAHCLLLPADWLVLMGHADPAAGWRDLGDEAAARAVVAAAGGMAAFAAAAMSGVASPTHGVRRGDVGIVVVEGPEGRAEVGGICTGARWAVRGRRGLWIGPAEHLAAWKVEARNGSDRHLGR